VRFVASDNIEALRRMARDPLYIGAPSAREIDGLVRIMDRAAEAAPTVETPVLVLVGEKDQLVKPDEVVEVAARVPGLDRLVRYPEGWHLLMVDRQAPTVWADVRDWVLALAPLDRRAASAEIVPRPAGARR
jgi:alpha-beta hydrolase superfamily lysophospholipase